MRLFSTLKSNKGSVLLLALISTIPISVGTVAFLTLQESRESFDRTHRQNLTANLIMKQIEKILFNADGCFNTLDGLDPGTSPAMPIKTPLLPPTIAFQAGDNISNTIQISSIRVVSTITPGEARVVVEFNRLGKHLGAEKFTRTTDVKVLPPAGAITSCHGKGAAGLANLSSMFDGGTVGGGQWLNPVVHAEVQPEALGVAGNLGADDIILDTSGGSTTAAISRGVFTVNGDAQTTAVTVAGSANLNNLSTEALEVSGTLNLPNSNVVNATSQVCSGATCSSFSPLFCPGGTYLTGINGNGTLVCWPW